MENIIYYLKEDKDKYTINIGSNIKSSDSNSSSNILHKLNQHSNQKLEFLIGDSVKLIESAICFDKILNNNDNVNVINNIINELYAMTLKFIDELKLKMTKLSKEEIWTLAFIKLLKRSPILASHLFNELNEYIESNPINKKRIDLLINNEYEKFEVCFLWDEFNKYLNTDIPSNYISLKTNNFINLQSIKHTLTSFLNRSYNIDSIVNIITKSIGIYEYNDYNNPDILITDNYKITPIIPNKQTTMYYTSIPKKNPISVNTDEIILYNMFRAVNINLTSDDASLLILFMLLSEYPMDKKLEDLLIKMVQRKTYINNLVNMLGSKLNDLYVIYAKLLLHNKKKRVKHIFGGQEFRFKAFGCISLKSDINTIIHIICFEELLNKNNGFYNSIMYQNKSDIIDVGNGMTININNNMTILYHRIKKHFSSLPFTEIYVNDLCSTIKNIIKHIQNDNNKNKYKDFDMSKLIFQKNIAKANNFNSSSTSINIINNDDLSNNKFYKIFKKTLFGSLILNCCLCDNIIFSDSHNSHYLECGEHSMCNKCADKLYRTNNYQQGDFANEQHFVCPFCRQPETNIIFVLPENKAEFYQNISKYRL